MRHKRKSALGSPSDRPAGQSQDSLRLSSSFMRINITSFKQSNKYQANKMISNSREFSTNSRSIRSQIYPMIRVNSTLVFLMLVGSLIGLSDLANSHDLKSEASNQEPISLISSYSAHVLAPNYLIKNRVVRQVGDELIEGSTSTRISGVDDELESAGATSLANLSLEQIEAEERNDATLLSQPFDYHNNMPVITKRELTNAIKSSSNNVKKSFDSKDNQDQVSLQNFMGSPGWLASSLLHKPTNDQEALNQTFQALVSEEATRQLSKQYKLKRSQILRGLPLISVDQTNLGKLCQRPSKTHNCIPGKYRSLSGHCNNVQNSEWASAHTPLIRYAPARYLDHVSRPIPSTKSLALNRDLLPSSRAISMALYGSTAKGLIGDSDKPVGVQHSHMTTMMSFFGQLLFHDLVYVSQFTSAQRSPIKCCNLDTGKATSSHPECMPIELRTSDENYCLDYVRSTPAIRAGCNLGPRDQLNLVSSYLDGSVVYGSSEEQMRQLRSFSGGRLRSQRPSTASTLNQPDQQAELLPQIKPPFSPTAESNELNAVWSATANDCRQMALMKSSKLINLADNSRASLETSNKCFLAGDDRANENIGLALMHTIWMREHNHIADKLAKLNGHWTDERIFHESRRILIAELQHIAYSEFLPSILGEEVMQRFNLSTQTQGYSQNYDPQLNAAISNEVATAVFPFILSTIPSSLERYSDRLEMLGTTSLADTFMDGSELFKRNKFAQYLMGMISQSAMEPAQGIMPMTMDMMSARFKKRQVSNSTNRDPPLVDAVALTIQQARDHGLKPYLYWRRLCQLKPQIRDWPDLKQVMSGETVDRLRQVYSSVEQIDLYLAVLETPMAGATLGPTFACLLARQFYHLKHGDRYWYENDLPDSAFTPKQLEEIRQTSLAKVLCRNSQASINFVQPTPMLTSDPYLNAYQYCTNRAMVQLDLSKWQEPVTSASQPIEEIDGSVLVRGKRLIESNVELISESLKRAKRQIESVAYEQTVKLRRLARSTSQTAAQTHHGYHHMKVSEKTLAGYRYLPRAKRQALEINNQSLIFELATNDVVRSLVGRGKDREHAQSIQNDIRDFLYSLETIQLDNLLDNSGSSNKLNEFITGAGGAFLTEDQRRRLIQQNDPTISGDPAIEALAQSGVRSSSISDNCQGDTNPCDHTTPFRTITGWCNNLQMPKFGQSFTPLDRLLPNAYEDKLSKPRQLSVIVSNTESGQLANLPSARIVSTTVHDDKSNLHVRYSLALMQFGQFGVDHDLTRTPFSVALDGSLLDCSACDSKRTVHRDCLPIEIPDDDAHFQSPEAKSLTGKGKKCLHFVRSLNGQTGLGPRQQINALTAYIDGSNIYGSDNCEAKSLRAFVGGRLNSSTYFVTLPGQASQSTLREILPLTKANPECVTPNGFCFHAGDQRASEQPGLTSIHTIFLRLHNSIVGQLAAVNKHWNDEKLYQHGRRIVGAIAQRITYGEFAPRLLGLDYMSKYDLLLKNVGYSNHYDESCSASILTEFAAAAFRMGHSLIRNAFPLLNKQFKPIGKAFQLRKAFFNSQRILSEPNLMDSILRGIVSTPIESLDNSITEELTNHLFERPKQPFSGMDLISLNIQRARDHGIGGYNKYRVKCNLTKARSFEDLSGEIPARLVKRLASIYASVDDIDLFAGGMSEMPVHGGIIGPTFGCIIGTQFQRLKRCDRFWHETNDPWVRFSAAQLAEIRKMTLAKIICQESDSIDMIQRNAMDIPDNFLNPRVACTSLPSMDLSVWRENLKSCLVNGLKLELGQSKRMSPCKSCTCTAEGPVCRTAKINCVRLMRQSIPLSSIMADKLCLVQCAWALDMQNV